MFFYTINREGNDENVLKDVNNKVILALKMSHFLEKKMKFAD